MVHLLVGHGTVTRVNERSGSAGWNVRILLRNAVRFDQRAQAMIVLVQIPASGIKTVYCLSI